MILIGEGYLLACVARGEGVLAGDKQNKLARQNSVGKGLCKGATNGDVEYVSEIWYVVVIKALAYHIDRLFVLARVAYKNIVIRHLS